MNANVFKGYFLMVSSGLVLVAALVLLILQWGNHTQLSLYGKNIEQASTLLLMVLSAIGGLVMLFLAKILLRGLVALKKGRQEQAIKLVTEQARQKNA